MKYALVNDEPQEAQPNLTGLCNCCGSPTIAKCGKVNIWHWAHLGKRMCDPWWENETEWHRAWKNQFPKDWQEVVQYADNGEKHIADVKIDQGCVIEFQHSLIKPEERHSREVFYKKMIWIVDGLRRSRDKKKFLDIWENSKSIANTTIRRLRPFIDECALLRDWIDSNSLVFYDFGEDTLWGLLPITNEVKGKYVFRIDRRTLIASFFPEQKVNGIDELLNACIKLVAKDEINCEIRKAILDNQQVRWPRISNFERRQRSRRRF